MLNASTISRSVFWRVVETGGSEVVALLSFVVMARILAPDAFGAVAIAIGAAVIWFFLPKKQKELELVESYATEDADKA